MGTSTIFRRHNDLHMPLKSMTKEELEKIDKLSPYSTENERSGWKAALELHNGNVEILVWWKGKLFSLRDAPEKLTKKYYDKYTGKELNIYEWTLLKNITIKEIKEFDKKFKKTLRANKGVKINGQ